jgi:hypothetical protein
MGIKFFKKNILDLTNLSPAFTITDSVATDTGEDFTDLMRNRNNSSGWATTGSSDAGTTTMIVDFIETKSFDAIILIGHNFKNFTLKYWDGAAYQNFSTAIAETTNSATTTYHTFTSVSSNKLQLIINGTTTADSDKFLKQFIVTEILGTFSVEPEVKPEFDKDRKATKFLSGKQFVAKSVGGFTCQIRMKSVNDNTDLTLVETLFNSYEGFLVWICGGTTSQFETVRHGYRLEDIFFMDLANEYKPEFVESRWYMGLPIELKLVEVS